jgi:putative ABC transport system permease protein
LNPWPVVAADLRRSRAGVVAIILLVALAVALGIAVSAQERALREGSARAAEALDLLIGAPGSETQLVLSTVYLQPSALDLIDGRLLVELEADEDVAFAAPIGFGDSYAGYAIVGTTAAFLAHAAGGEMEEGRPFERIDEAVVGTEVDLELGATFVPVHGQVEVEDAEGHEGFGYWVVGRMPAQGNPWDRAIVTSIESVSWVHALPVGHVLDQTRVWPEALGNDPELAAIPLGPPWDAEELPGVPAIVVKPASFGAAYQLRQQYRSADTTMAVFPAEVLVQLYALLGNVRDLLAVIAIADPGSGDRRGSARGARDHHAAAAADRHSPRAGRPAQLHLRDRLAQRRHHFVQRRAARAGARSRRRVAPLAGVRRPDGDRTARPALAAGAEPRRDDHPDRCRARDNSRHADLPHPGRNRTSSQRLIGTACPLPMGQAERCL